MRAAPQIRRGLKPGLTQGGANKDPSDDARMIAAIDADGGRYPIDKLDAHRKGILHDAISVFVFDGEAMLLQQRAAAKYHCPGQWANACCTHPDWGEDAAASARRRLNEELGIDLALNEVGVTTYRANVGKGLIEHERVRLFRADTDRSALDFNLHPDEVSAVRWATPAALLAEVEAHPEHFTPWLKIYLDRWATLGVAV